MRRSAHLILKTSEYHNITPTEHRLLSDCWITITVAPSIPMTFKRRMGGGAFSF